MSGSRRFYSMQATREFRGQAELLWEVSACICVCLCPINPVAAQGHSVEVVNRGCRRIRAKARVQDTSHAVRP